MAKLLGWLEANFGRYCPGCQTHEWPTKFKTREVKRWSEGSWWNRTKFKEMRYEHRACGHVRYVKVDITPSGGGGE